MIRIHKLNLTLIEVLNKANFTKILLSVYLLTLIRAYCVVELFFFIFSVQINRNLLLRTEVTKYFQYSLYT